MRPQHRTRAGELSFAPVRAGLFALTRADSINNPAGSPRLQARQYNHLCDPDWSHCSYPTRRTARLRSNRLPGHLQRLSAFPYTPTSPLRSCRGTCVPPCLGSVRTSCATAICRPTHPASGERETTTLIPPVLHFTTLEKYRET